MGWSGAHIGWGQRGGNDEVRAVHAFAGDAATTRRKALTAIAESFKSVPRRFSNMTRRFSCNKRGWESEFSCHKVIFLGPAAHRDPCALPVAAPVECGVWSGVQGSS